MILESYLFGALAQARLKPWLKPLQPCGFDASASRVRKSKQLHVPNSIPETIYKD
jgi:hypothetical protein